MDLDVRALDFKRQQIPYCWATVVHAEGSSPRHTGAKMIVTRTETFGTIGGGALEQHVTTDAREALRLRAPQLKRYDLTTEGVQPCGGVIDIFLEPVTTPQPLVLFGAGHIAEQLVPLLASMEFEVTLIDERRERLTLPAFQSVARRIEKLPLEAISEIAFAPELHILCMTHAHRHDRDIVRACLGKSFQYFGLIGSRSKWALFCEELARQGISDAELKRITTPVGFDIGAETPFEIAISITAQLLQLRAKPVDFAHGIGHFH